MYKRYICPEDEAMKFQSRLSVATALRIGTASGKAASF